MLGVNTLRSLRHATFALGLGILTTLGTIALGVYFGPPPMRFAKENEAVFRVPEGMARTIGSNTSRFVTQTHAGLILAPIHPGQKPGTIVVQWRDSAWLDPKDIDDFLKQFDTEQQQTKALEADIASHRQLSPQTQEPSRFYGEEYSLLDSSPLFGSSFCDITNATIISEFALGYPMRAAWTADYEEYTGGCEINLLGPSHWYATTWKRPAKGMFASSGFTADYGVPTGLIPLGFAANTTLYAAAWFALFSIPTFVRSRIAKQKNTCPACRYSLQGLPTNAPCPECGGQRTAH